MIRTQGKQRSGISLLELAVVVFIGAVFLSLVFPALYAAQVAGGKRETENNLKQVILSTHAFNDVYKFLPPASGTVGNRGIGLKTTLHIHILPYVEQDKLYKKYLQAAGEDVAPEKVPPFLSVQDPSVKKQKQEGLQNFAANLRVFSDKGVVAGLPGYDKNLPALEAEQYGSSALPRTFPDGTSNTIGFATKYGYCDKEGGSRYASMPNTKKAAFFGQNAAKKKAHPTDADATFQLQPDSKQCLCVPLMAQSFTKDGLLLALADGSVRTVTSKLTPQTWNMAMQPNDGQPLGDDW